MVVKLLSVKSYRLVSIIRAGSLRLLSENPQTTRHFFHFES
jgi:hypothetical protein